MNDDMRRVLRHLADHFRSPGARRLETPFDVPGLPFDSQVAPALRRLATATPPFIIGIDVAQADYPMIVTGLTERGWEAAETGDDSRDAGAGRLPASDDAPEAGLPPVRLHPQAPSSRVDASCDGPERSMARAVFIVHGHDSATKTEVARTVHLLTGINPTILHEKPSQGRTLIEKFEGHASKAGFVVVLATADDIGRDKAAKKEQPRARQNVVFEWGFFVGALGREKVAVLYQEGVELPSDILGVTYIPLGVGSQWKHELAREMRFAGVDADANRL